MSFENPRRKLGSRPERIDIEGKTFTFVTRQRGDISAIYRSDNLYVRIGDPERIRRDLALHKRMKEAGFPVASIVAEGEYGNEAYFVESSLGNEHLGATFAADVEQTGSIGHESFGRFLNVAEQFARAQLGTVTETRDFDAFSRGILLEKLCEELPDYARRLRQRFAEAQANLAPLPFVLTHGDFNPNNLYPAGVIDLEDSFQGPYGYDLVGAVAHIDSFPDSHEYEYFAKYRFTPEQRNLYQEMIDRVSSEASQPSPTQFSEDLEFCRAVWLAAGIPHTPKLQRFRYDFVISRFLD